MSEIDELLSCGFCIVPSVLGSDQVVRLRGAAERCFKDPTHSHSMLIGALGDEVALPSAVEPLLRAAIGGDFECNREESWLRRKFERSGAHSWHQDGGLWVQFPPVAGPMPPMTQLATCWVPLDDCDGTRPALELVRVRLGELLHFTELDDALLRRRFTAEAFYVPMPRAGDAVIFLNGTLHRTHVTDAMTRDRISVEYRVFPGGSLRVG